MANHNLPTLTSTYANFVTEMDARMDDISIGFDPAFTIATNFPTGTVRWVSGSNKWEKWSGSAWADLSSAYAISISGNAATVTNGVYTSATYANPTWITSIAGTKVSGAISGNAGSATQLANARNINGVAFDGTAAINVNLNNTATFNNGGSGAASGSTFNGSAALTISYNTVGAPSVSGTNATGTWSIGITGNAATVTNGVYTTGAQSIAGVKTFTDGIVGNVTGTATTATTATSATTAAALSTATGSAPSYAARAWVNFSRLAGSGTYTRSGNLVTCSLALHGMTTGQLINLTFLAGTGGIATNGNYTVTVVNPNTFTITDTVSGTITGSPTFTRNSFIRGSGNVSSIGDNGTGWYTVNFTTAMPDPNYTISGTAANAYDGMILSPVSGGLSTGYCVVYTLNSNSTSAVDSAYISVVIHR